MQSENGILLLFYIFLSHGNEKKKKKKKKKMEKRGYVLSTSTCDHSHISVTRNSLYIYIYYTILDYAKTMIEIEIYVS